MSTRGKQATVEETVRANMGLVETVIEKHFRNHERYGASLEDLRQMGALGLARAHEKLDVEKGSFGTHAFWEIRGAITKWLRSYGAHCSHKHLDGRWNHKLLSQLGPADDDRVPMEPCASESDAPDVIVCARDQTEMLRSVLRSLEPRARTILRMRYLEGRTYDEIGAALGLTRQRIRQLEPIALLVARRKWRRTPTSRRMEREEAQVA